MPKMIIHTPTRIVRRMTTDPSHFTAADETTEDVADGMDIGGGPWKLSVNAKSLLTPTLAEPRRACRGIQDAGGGGSR